MFVLQLSGVELQRVHVESLLRQVGNERLVVVLKLQFWV